MNSASVPDLNASLLGMNQGRREELKKIVGQVSSGSIVRRPSEPMSNEIWNAEAQFQLITGVFEEELKRVSKRLDIGQISLIMDEYLAFQYYARLGLLKV